MKESLRSLIVREAAACVGREGSTLSQARADLKRRYLGHGYSSDAERGERGLSTYVDRTVLETVEWAKPGLMRLFGGGEEIIRFEPRCPEQEEAAEAATVYVNQAAFGRNMFRLVHDVLTDGLFQRVGWCLAHSVRREERRMRRFSGLTRDEALALAAETAQEGAKLAGGAADPQLWNKASYDNGLSESLPEKGHGSAAHPAPASQEGDAEPHRDAEAPALAGHPSLPAQEGTAEALSGELVSGPLSLPYHLAMSPRNLCWSGRRDLNPRLQPWQGCTLPLSYSRVA